jgi:hypothetical protein
VFTGIYGSVPSVLFYQYSAELGSSQQEILREILVAYSGKSSSSGKIGMR